MAAGEADTTASHPISASADAAAIRVWCSMPGLSASLTKLITAPNFCARPEKFSRVVAVPSRCAAIDITAPIVVTPVPPTPVTRMS